MSGDHYMREDTLKRAEKQIDELTIDELKKLILSKDGFGGTWWYNDKMSEDEIKETMKSLLYEDCDLMRPDIKRLNKLYKIIKKEEHQ